MNLKFRMWDKVLKIMVYTDFRSFRNWYNHPKGGKVVFPRQNGDEPIMQFTGKIDNKGREIFKHDIYFEEVEHEGGDEREYYICEWINEWSRFCWLHLPGELQNYEDNGVKKLDHTMINTFGLDVEKMHYAGNRYQNKDLIAYGCIPEIENQ